MSAVRRGTASIASIAAKERTYAKGSKAVKYAVWILRSCAERA
jgi:hypothetical protein